MVQTGSSPFFTGNDCSSGFLLCSNYKPEVSAGPGGSPNYHAEVSTGTGEVQSTGKHLAPLLVVARTLVHVIARARRKAQ